MKPQPCAPALLVRLPNWIGDVVMALPALMHLHDHGRALTLLGRPWAASLLQGMPWTVRPIGRRRGERIEALRAAAREAGTRSVLLMTNSFSSAFEARWAGLRPTGFSHDGRALLLSRRVSRPAADAALAQHALVNLETQRYNALAAAITGHPVDPARLPKLTVHPWRRAQLIERLRGHGIDPARSVVLVPFATGQLKSGGLHGKQWPGFADLCRRLATDLGDTSRAASHAGADRATPLRPAVLIAPGPDEVDQARERFPGATLLEGLDMGHYAALMASCPLVVANDTGPGHVAAAVGTRLVSVLGPTDADVHGVRGDHVTIIGGAPVDRPMSPTGRDRAWQWPGVDAVHAAALERLGMTRSADAERWR